MVISASRSVSYPALSGFWLMRPYTWAMGLARRDATTDLDIDRAVTSCGFFSQASFTSRKIPHP
jgi:hypothetical protein